VKPLMSHLHRSPARFLRLVAALALLVVCRPPQALAHTHRCEARAERSHLSLRVADLESWEPLDERTVLVWAPDATRAHLLRLSQPLAALEGSPMLTFIDGDHDGAITACGHDGVMVQGSRRARIVSITYLSEKRTVELDRHHIWAVPLEATVRMQDRRRALRS
jgi:hypothetical protein